MNRGLSLLRNVVIVPSTHHMKNDGSCIIQGMYTGDMNLKIEMYVNESYVFLEN